MRAASPSPHSFRPLCGSPIKKPHPHPICGGHGERLHRNSRLPDHTIEASLSGGLAVVSYVLQATMAYTRTISTKAAATHDQARSAEPAFHPLGAIFETSSDSTPFVGKADANLLEAFNLVAPEGKEWKIFVRSKTSKAGKPYLSVYPGLSDLRR